MFGLSKFLAGAPTLPHGCSFQISPQASMHRALQELQKQIPGFTSSEDFNICFDAGVHTLGGQPLLLDERFNREDGGRVVWKSTDSQRLATVDGGIEISDWKRCDDGTHCQGSDWHGVWVHYFADVEPAVPRALLPVRQLWVDGMRAQRVSLDAGQLGLATDEQGYRSDLPPSAFDHWVHSKVELRWPNNWNWIEPRCIVTGVTVTQGGTLIIVEPVCWKAFIDRVGGLNNVPPPMLVENVHMPPNAGEFSATPEAIFYRPRTGQEYQRPADTWIPYQESLLKAEKLVNHEWRQIQFRHATWRQPSRTGGYVPGQTAVIPSGEPDGAVDVRQSRHIVFDQCHFVHLGSIYALAIHHRSQHVQVNRSHFSHLSGGAIKLGNVDGERALRTDPEEFDDDMLLWKSTLEEISLEFRDAAAVFAGYVRHTIIEQNTIKNCGYTGISLGWGWGTYVYGPQTFARENHVRRNRLVGVMSAMNDGGCIYTLGPQPDSSVEGNYCKRNPAPTIGFFYFDNGSRYFRAFNNVADSGAAPCVYIQGCCNQPALDIEVSNVWCRATAPSQNNCQDKNCRIDDATHYVLGAESDEFPPEAQAIIDAAGATPAVATIQMI